MSTPRAVKKMIRCKDIQDLLKSMRLLKTVRLSVLKGIIREAQPTFNESLHPTSVDE